MDNRCAHIVEVSDWVPVTVVTSLCLLLEFLTDGFSMSEFLVFTVLDSMSSISCLTCTPYILVSSFSITPSQLMSCMYVTPYGMV